MPALDWIGKQAVVNHHLEVPYRLLQGEAELSVGEAGSGNLLVEGDNLEALKALLPYYAGQVKCIYIDPPYNTGEQKWTYSDHVSSPEIAAWLGKTVRGEAEDLSRHDKWLCMMYPRVRLLTDFLREDGFLMVSLNDEGEVARFRVMMDEIMPERFVCSLVWKSRRNLDNRSQHNVSVDHEYVLVYRRLNGVFRGASKDLSKYSNPDHDPRGPWSSDNLVGLATKDRRPNLHYDLTNPETGMVYTCPRMGWRYSRETMAQKMAEGRILWPKSKSGRPRHKKFLNELQNEFAGFSSLVECGNTNEGTLEVRQILGEDVFMFPKPRSLVQELIEQTTDQDSLVMDSFAGSGTTGHAVMDLNAQDGGQRRFILVELENSIARNVTQERLRRVVEGYSYRKDGGEEVGVEGLGGGFRYCTLGAALFDGKGCINPEVKFRDLAQHVFFIETREPLLREIAADNPLIGVSAGVAYYLLYNGVLRDKRVNGGNVLTKAVLAQLPPHDGPKVIYALQNRMGQARLEAEKITFRHIPYDVGVRW